MDGLRLARTYARGPLSDGRRTRKSIWQKNFLRSRRSFGLSASVRLPLASTPTQLTSWRRAGCGISHSLPRQSISTQLFIYQYKPQSPSDQPFSMNVPCTPAKTTPHSPKRMFHDLYMFIIATSSMFMTATFIPYHSVPAQPNYHLHYSCSLRSSCTTVVNRSASLAVRFLAKCSALLFCPCSLTARFLLFASPRLSPPLSYQFFGDPCITLLFHSITRTWTTSDTTQ